MVYYEGQVFTKEECEEILKHAQEFKKSGLDVVVGRNDYGTSYQPNKRKSTQSQQKSYKGELVFKKMNSILGTFGYELTEDSLPFDVIKYEEGDFIWKHKDDNGSRIMSCVIQLNDDDDYEGGDFLYWLKDEEHRMSRKQGYGMVFIAGVYHEVLPITLNKRHSLVIFFKSTQIKKIGGASLF